MIAALSPRERMAEGRVRGRADMAPYLSKAALSDVAPSELSYAANCGYRTLMLRACSVV